MHTLEEVDGDMLAAAAPETAGGATIASGEGGLRLQKSLLAGINAMQDGGVSPACI